jgi:hypothetical protein
MALSKLSLCSRRGDDWTDRFNVRSITLRFSSIAASSPLDAGGAIFRRSRATPCARLTAPPHPIVSQDRSIPRAGSSIVRDDTGQSARPRITEHPDEIDTNVVASEDIASRSHCAKGQNIPPSNPSLAGAHNPPVPLDSRTADRVGGCLRPRLFCRPARGGDRASCIRFVQELSFSGIRSGGRAGFKAPSPDPKRKKGDSDCRTKPLSSPPSLPASDSRSSSVWSSRSYDFRPLQVTCWRG